MRRFGVAAAMFLAAGSAALAADLPYRQAPPPYVPPAFTWTGFYVGINGAGAVGGNIRGSTLPPLPLITARTSLGGFVAGGTVGYNYQFTPGAGFVVGIEGDAGYGDLGSTTSIGVAGLGTARLRAVTDTYFATIRGRLGYAWGPWLVYATGGWAFTELTLGASVAAFGGGAIGINSTRSLDGYTVGGGVEYAFSPSLSAKAEYLYADFDPAVFGIGAGGGIAGIAAPNLRFTPRVRAGLDVHLLKVGINYRFNLFN